jgi:type III secretion protein U
LAVAINCERKTCPVPESWPQAQTILPGQCARRPRKLTCSIVHNVPLARDPLGRSEVSKRVPADLVDIVTGLHLWACEVRRALEEGEGSA